MVIFTVVNTVVTKVTATGFAALACASAVRFLTCTGSSTRRLTSDANSTRDDARTRRTDRADGVGCTVGVLSACVRVFSAGRFCRAITSRLGGACNASCPTSMVGGSAGIRDVRGATVFRFAAAAGSTSLDCRVTRYLREYIPREVGDAGRKLILTSIRSPPVGTSTTRDVSCPGGYVVNTTTNVFLTKLCTILESLLSIEVGNDTSLSNGCSVPVLNSVPRFGLAERGGRTKHGNGGRWGQQGRVTLSTRGFRGKPKPWVRN